MLARLLGRQHRIGLDWGDDWFEDFEQGDELDDDIGEDGARRRGGACGSWT